MNNTLFNRVKEHLNSFGYNEIILRQMVITCLSKKPFTYSSVDTYLCYFKNADYLIPLGKGCYRLYKEIPKTLTVKQLEKEAYGTLSRQVSLSD